MKIAIIGVGLYGAYIANELCKNKKFNLDLYDKRKKILDSTAKKNQYRLHTGYHYPRSKETILQTIKGFKIFKKKFNKYLYFPKKNYYLIHKNSWISFSKYQNIFNNLNLKFSTIKKNNYSKYLNTDKILGGINTEEGVILIDKLILNLKKNLKSKTNIYLNQKIEKIDNSKGLVFLDKKKFKKYDYIINTTYENPNLGLTKNKFKLKYELTGMVKISKPFKEQLGITIMDGPFCSLYPQNKKVCTVSSVKYTPIFKSNSFKKINEKVKILNKDKVKNKILKHVSEYIKFNNKNMKSSLILSHKVKLRNDKNDLRTSSVKYENKLISILCGKIDAAPVIFNEIKKKIYS